jgi:DNA-binding transcriptional LysR family regulator
MKSISRRTGGGASASSAAPHAIHYGDFRRVDLNLLVAFAALLDECHVGRAAARLFIGQPAMSHALARLRELFGDDLFVRTGRRMEPTPLAQQLAPRVRAWLDEGAGLLLGEQPFNPAKAEGEVRVSIPDGLEALLLPPLVAELRAEAPQVRLRAQLLEVDQLTAALDADEVDLAVAAVDVDLRDWHQRVSLMTSGFHCLYAREQLSLPSPVGLAQLAELDHLVSSHRGAAGSVVDQAFAAQGLARRVVVASASMIAVAQILKRAPLVSIQPALYAGLHDFSGLVVEPLATEPPLRVSVDLLWHRRSERQPLLAYVRARIVALAAAIGHAEQVSAR